MKKTLLRVSAVLLLSFQLATAFAQAPQKMSYQAVIRNSSNTLVTSSSVGMQISILQGSSTGTAVYVETQTSTTNANGLVTIEIGNGTAVTGTFSAIDWSAGPYFIMTETDPNGGSTYTITGTTQLMSVPYALYAATSGNGAGATGATGATGADGMNGTNGVDGMNGTNGVDGAMGATGADGINGTNGIDGAMGATGATGADGMNGTNGIDGIAGATGVTGATGSMGMPGMPGTNGTNGATGATGATGAAGTNGSNGTNGIDGAMGSTGATGAMGPMGPMGMGMPGMNGTNGTNGATGATGATGTAGTNGTNGSNGATGAMGSTGATGSAGTNGTTGATGAVGVTGSSGATGVTGATGLADGTAAGNTPYWNGTAWVTNSSNIFNNGGNIGLGTITPTRKLEVAGDGIRISNTANAVLELQNVTSGNQFRFQAGAAEIQVYDASAGATRLAITNAGNVGIGTATPLGGLDVNAPLGANSWSYFRGNLNSTNPSSSFTNGLAIGWNKSGAGGETNLVYGNGAGVSKGLEIGEWNGTAYAPRMTIKASTGNVGIGTTAPGYKLAVVDAGNVAIYAQSLAANSLSQLVLANPEREFHITNNANDDLVSFFYGASNRLQFNLTNQWFNSGNVGIGTSTPNAALQLGNVLTNRRIVLWESSNNDHLFFGLGINTSMMRYQVDAPSASHAFFAGTSTTTSNELMRITGNGNVGIGTSAPQRLLNINSTGPNVESSMIYTKTGSTEYLISGIASDADVVTVGGTSIAGKFFMHSYNSDFQIAAAGARNIEFGTNGVNRMYINSSGNVGLGTTTPTAKLEVNGYTKLGTTAPAIAILKLTGTTAAAQGGFVSIPHGLNTAKIISITLLIEHFNGEYITQEFEGSAGFRASLTTNTTSVNIGNYAGNSGNILNRPFKVLITYEQ
jgi:hypothetical protein